MNTTKPPGEHPEKFNDDSSADPQSQANPEHSDLPKSDALLDEWIKQMRDALNCGGSPEETAKIIQKLTNDPANTDAAQNSLADDQTENILAELKEYAETINTLKAASKRADLTLSEMIRLLSKFTKLEQAARRRLAGDNSVSIKKQKSKRV